MRLKTMMRYEYFELKLLMIGLNDWQRLQRVSNVKLVILTQFTKKIQPKLKLLEQNNY